MTASLFTFLVFGTTKSWRQYRDLVVGGCGLKRKIILKKAERDREVGGSQGREFQRLDSLPRRESQEIRRNYPENRVQMFVNETGPEHSDGSGAPITRSGPLIYSRAESVSHKSMPPTRTALKQPSSGVVEISFSIDQQDEVIPYMRREGNQHIHTHQLLGNK